ncbi:hypothetical protein C2G38_2203050 [Gigaspora rosea]|uniref:Uncharacterized protein n=1 Tax=Gigaspora rosea TaxID=44941 RepID=A0A397UMV8_9GLOM|nr:hypothetical protein C2G38_2203050 [Gigaspora rosea]
MFLQHTSANTSFTLLQTYFYQNSERSIVPLQNNMYLTESTKSNKLDLEAGQMLTEALYENTVSDPLNFNLNPSQVIGF